MTVQYCTVQYSAVQYSTVWAYMPTLAEYQSLIQIWKTLYSKKPEYLYEKLITDDEDDLRTTEPRLQLTEGSFRWKAVKDWRMLPENVRKQDKLRTFKKELKLWLQDRRNIDPDWDRGQGLRTTRSNDTAYWMGWGDKDKFSSLYMFSSSSCYVNMQSAICNTVQFL